MQVYSTTDIVLAAYLKVKGFRIQKIDKSGTMGTFYFDGVDDDVLNEFHLGQSLVEPVAFNNAVKFLTTSVRRMG